MNDFDVESLCVFKLTSGEIIICEIVSEDKEQIIIRYAIQVIQIIQEEEEEIKFVQWIPFTEDLIILYPHAILAVAPPSEEMKQVYLNKMVELDQEEITPEPPPVEPVTFRRTCSSGTFTKKK